MAETGKMARVSLKDFLRSLQEGRLVVLSLFVVSIAVALFILATQQPSYRASTLVNVEVQLPQKATAEAFEAAIAYANNRTITLEVLVVSDPILDSVIDRLDLGVTARDLSDQVTALSALDTNIIEIRVTWPDAQQSAEIANAIAEQSVRTFSADNEAVAVQLVQVERAEAASAPVVPNPAMTLGLAVFAATLASMAWIVSRRSGLHRSSVPEV